MEDEFGIQTPVVTNISDGTGLSKYLRFGKGNATGDAVNSIGYQLPSVADNIEATGAGKVVEQTKMGKLLGSLGSGVSILGDLSQIYFGFQQQKRANEQLKTQTAFANANLGNSVQAYNNSLNDKLTSRGFTQGDSSSQTQAAINSKSLNFSRVG